MGICVNNHQPSGEIERKAEIPNFNVPTVAQKHCTQ